MNQNCNLSFVISNWDVREVARVFHASAIIGDKVGFETVLLF